MHLTACQWQSEVKVNDPVLVLRLCDRSTRPLRKCLRGYRHVDNTVSRFTDFVYRLHEFVQIVSVIVARPCIAVERFAVQDLEDLRPEDLVSGSDLELSQERSRYCESCLVQLRIGPVDSDRCVILDSYHYLLWLSYDLHANLVRPDHDQLDRWAAPNVISRASVRDVSKHVTGIVVERDRFYYRLRAVVVI